VLTLALGLAASLVWGSADFLGGLSARRSPLWTVVLVAQLGGLAFAVTIWVAAAGSAPEPAALLAGAGGGAAGVIAVAAFYRALAIGTMGVVAPIAATGAAVPVAVGLLSGERPTAVQLVGAAVATAGVALAARERTSGRSAAHTRSVLLAAVAAVGFGLTFVGLERAGDADPYWAILTARATAAALVVLAAAAVRPRLERPSTGRGLATLVLVGVLDTAANVLFVLAAEEGLLSVVSVLGSLYPAVTVLLARWVLDERLDRSQAAGVVLTLLGVAGIAAG